MEEIVTDAKQAPTAENDARQLPLWADSPAAEDPAYLTRQLITCIGNKRARLLPMQVMSCRVRYAGSSAAGESAQRGNWRASFSAVGACFASVTISSMLATRVPLVGGAILPRQGTFHRAAGAVEPR